MSDCTMSRRSFVAGAAVAGAAVASASALTAQPAQAKVIAETSPVWDLEEVGEPTETLSATSPSSAPAEPAWRAPARPSSLA